MNQAEQRYPITDQECLAIVWAIKHFSHYLELQPFVVMTDHSALKWLQTSKKLPKGRRGRWVMELQQYRFDIQHKPGKENTNANARSRMYEKDIQYTNCFMIEISAPKRRRRSRKNYLEVFQNQQPDHEEYDADSEEDDYLLAQHPEPWECCGEIVCECDCKTHDSFAEGIEDLMEVYNNRHSSNHHNEWDSYSEDYYDQDTYGPHNRDENAYNNPGG
jgi:hypothetical protein